MSTSASCAPGGRGSPTSKRTGRTPFQLGQHGHSVIIRYQNSDRTKTTVGLIDLAGLTRADSASMHEHDVTSPDGTRFAAGAPTTRARGVAVPGIGHSAGSVADAAAAGLCC
ncbi:hypothetical protein [Kibdelosporangium philippinense]|uniref:hypothetical protein n=1 Tax=Kibdelosporangium philippinense TaxID=211113 RepID=UPI00360712B1